MDLRIMETPVKNSFYALRKQSRQWDLKYQRPYRKES